MTDVMRCDGFEERVTDYLGNELDVATRAAMDAHVASCDRCRALLADLRSIVTAAGALPVLSPSRDLWDGIAPRIEETVVVPSLDARRRTSARPGERRWSVRPSWIAVAAALLIAATAGVTSLVLDSDGSVSTASAPIAAVPAVAAAPEAAPRESTAAAEPQLATAPSGSSAEGAPAAPVATKPAAGTTRLASTRRSNAPLGGAVATYEQEIATLRRIVEERRDELDPATIAILEINLTVIDQAIAQSRSALVRDPRSAFLLDQLNHTLEQKLNVLRIAALLPARS